MNKSALASLFAKLGLILALSLSAAACAASIGEADDGTEQPGDPNDPNDPTPNDPTDPTDDPSVCVGDGVTGDTCAVTSDCDSPLVCLSGVCVGPSDPSIICDPIEGIACPESNEVCVGGACVVNPGNCTTVDDCPIGFQCTNGACVADGTDASCSDPGPGPALAGTWAVQSTLHLREGLPGLVAGLLDVSELLADFINGNVNLGLPSAVELLIGSLIQGIIDQYVPNWAQEMIIGLAGISDVLDTMEVDSTWNLTGQVCDGTYRGSSTWDWLTFEYRGMVITEQPQNIPQVGAITPEDFGARYSCGELFIDKHRIHNSLGGLIRWMVDTVVEIATGYPTVETALGAALPCGQIAAAINSAWQSACGCSTNVTAVVQSTCDSYKNDLIAQVTQLLDDAVVTLSVVSLKGKTTVQNASTLSNGIWYGSVIGGDFPGEFSAQRQ